MPGKEHITDEMIEFCMCGFERFFEHLCNYQLVDESPFEMVVRRAGMRMDHLYRAHQAQPVAVGEEAHAEIKIFCVLAAEFILSKYGGVDKTGDIGELGVLAEFLRVAVRRNDGGPVRSVQRERDSVVVPVLDSREEIGVDTGNLCARHGTHLVGFHE